MLYYCVLSFLLALFTGSKEVWEYPVFPSGQLAGSTAHIVWVERSETMKMSFDSVVAMMRELSVEEQQALLDSDNRPALKKFLSGLQQLPSLLNPVGTIKVPSATKFVAADFFKVNIKKNASMKISYVWENFTNWFLGKIEESVANEAVSGVGPYRTPGQNGDAETVLRYQTLSRNSVDTNIINQLGGEAKVEIALADVAALMTKQNSGQQGALLTNGYANIFYVRDVISVLRAVGVYWDGDGWRVNACSVGVPREWHAGYRVFSRDS